MNIEKFVEFRREWKGLPIVDAEHELRIIPLPCDLLGAERKNPGHCVLVKACQRMFGSTRALIFPSRAYVELPDKRGKKRVERFFLGEAEYRFIHSFDLENPIIPNAGLVFRPMPPSLRFDKQPELLRKQKLKSRSEIRTGNCKGRSGTNKRTRVLKLDVRSGIGQVHFFQRVKG